MSVYKLLGTLCGILFIQQAAWSAPVYDFAYNGDMLPTAATPAWTVVREDPDGKTSGSDFAATDQLTNPGFLQFSSTVAGRPQWQTTWAPTAALDIEFRTKMISTDGAASGIIHLIPNISGEKRVIFTLGMNGVSASGAVLAPGATYDPAQWNVYRLTGEKVAGVWGFNVYVNGKRINTNPIPGQTASGSSLIIWGDTSGSNTGGVSQWDYIRWSDTQIVPEPVGAGLMALAGIGLVGRRSRRN